MAEERLFRLVLLCAWLAFVPVPAYYRIRSQSTGESLDRKQEGLFILITLRLAGLSTLFGLIAYLSHPSWMEWSSLPLSGWLRWTGLGLFVVGDVLLTWTLISLGKNLTDTVVTRREHTLVVSGPYAWVRHPFYDCVGLIVAGSALLAANWFIAAAGTLLFVMFATRSAIEEEKLIARFGDEYRRYTQRTGRFIPKIV
jgi:protein-S-isoprenylcysteine O-methyltransferase Ste14